MNEIMDFYNSFDASSLVPDSLKQLNELCSNASWIKELKMTSAALERYQQINSAVDAWRRNNPFIDHIDSLTNEFQQAHQYLEETGAIALTEEMQKINPLLKRMDEVDSIFEKYHELELQFDLPHMSGLFDAIKDSSYDTMTDFLKRAHSFPEAVVEIASAYSQDCDKATPSDTVDADNELANEPPSPPITRSDKWNNLSPLQKTIITLVIIPIIVNLLGSTLSKLCDKIIFPVNPTAAVCQSKTLYTINNQFDCSMLNDSGMRIVSKPNCVVRICPDRSSLVVATLVPGRVVQVIDKCKKWVQIMWTDSENCTFSGWTQNYKLTEF